MAAEREANPKETDWAAYPLVAVNLEMLRLWEENKKENPNYASNKRRIPHFSQHSKQKFQENSKIEIQDD